MSKVTTTFEANDQGMVATIKKIDSETKSMANSFDKAGKGINMSFGSMAKAGAGFAVGIGAVTAAVGAFKLGVNLLSAGLQASSNYILSAISSSSDLQETTSKVGVIFGDGAKEIEAWSKTAADAFGQSQNQAMGAAANFALFGKSAGLSGTELTRFSTDLVELAADLASFNNTSQDEAILAVGAALRGESEPMRRFGVSLDEMTMKNQALKMGLIETTTGALTPQQKVLASTALMFQMTSDAQGDYARTADGLANSTRTLGAHFADFKTIVGNAVMPIVGELFASLKDKLLPVMEKLKVSLSQIDLSGFGNVIAEAAVNFVDLLIGGIIKASKACELISLGLDLAVKSFANKMLESLGGLFVKLGLYINAGIFTAINNLKTGMYNAVEMFVNILVYGMVSAVSAFSDDLADKALASSKPLLDGIKEAAGTYSNKMDAANLKIEQDLTRDLEMINNSKPDDFFGANATKNKMAQLGKDFIAVGKEFRTNLSKSPILVPIMLAGVKTGTDLGIDFNPQMLQGLPTTNKNNGKKGAYEAETEFKGIVLKMDKSSLFLKEYLELQKTFKSSITKLEDQLVEAKIKKFTKSDELEEKLNDQISKGRFKQAEATIKKIEIDKEEAALRIDKEGNRDRRSLADIAKEMGIDTFNKKKSDLRKEVLAEKLKREAEKAGVDKGKKQKPEEKLVNIVELIKTVLEKIEPKLPTHALAL
jgi:hypothetical protein